MYPCPPVASPMEQLRAFGYAFLAGMITATVVALLAQAAQED